MYLNVLFLFSFVVAHHAAVLYPVNAVNTPCGYCYCCGPVATQQNPCCLMGCGNRCPTLYITPTPSIGTNPPSTPLITETSTTLIPTTHFVSPSEQLNSPVPCTIETCPPPPIIDSINNPPNAENFGNLPQAPPATSPYPNVQIAPIMLPGSEESRQVIPCGNPLTSPCSPPCGAPITGVVPSVPCSNSQQPCQASCVVLPPLEEQPCCLIFISRGEAQVFCGCEGNGTCLKNYQNVMKTCKAKATINVNVTDTVIIPCFQAVHLGIKLNEIEGCPADGLTGGASGISLFISVGLAAMSLFLCDQ